MARSVVHWLSTLVLALVMAAPGAAQICGDGAKAGGEQCDDGNSVGGDGCAANCTLERTLTCTLAAGSTSTVQAAFFAIPTPLSGQIVLTIGGLRADAPTQPVPFVIPAAPSHLAPNNIPGVGTACTSLGEIRGWGPGNAGGGFIDCGSTRIAGLNATVGVDSAEADPSQVVERSGTGPMGSIAFDLGATSYSLLVQAPFCAAQPDTGPQALGPDAIPCTGDDPGRPPAISFAASTGQVTARVLHANGETDSIEAGATGAAIDCAQLDSATVLNRATLVAAAPELDLPSIGDAAVVLKLVCEPTAEVPTPTPRFIQTCVPTATPTSTPPSGDTPTLAPSSTATAPATPTNPTAMATIAPTAPATEAATATAAAPTATHTIPAPTTPTATATGGAAVCVGDCDGDRAVAIDELIRAVNIALGSIPLARCASIDANGDAGAGIEELIRAVNNALQGCPA